MPQINPDVFAHTVPLPGVHYTPLPSSTLGNVLSDALAMYHGDDGRDANPMAAMRLIEAWVGSRYSGGPISIESDAFAAFSRIAQVIDPSGEDPDLRLVQDWIDPLPRDDDTHVVTFTHRELALIYDRIGHELAQFPPVPRPRRR